MDMQGTFSAALLAEAFTTHGSFPFPTTAWARAGVRLDSQVAEARRHLGEPWPELTLTGYLRHFQDGNRSAYELPYFLRRRRLGAAALALAATSERSFAHEAANGLWLICEESTWCVPAHARHSLAQGTASRLPGPGSGGAIDLFNCETALVLAEVCQLIGAQLDEIDDRIVPRVREEIRRRIIDPLLAGTVCWWQDGHNNWSVWCASSAIIAAGFALAGEPRSWAALVHSMLGVVDRYVNRQGADGGCDEGVMYWSVAGGCVIRALEEVRSRTGGLVDGWSLDPRIAEIVRFPARMHMGGGTVPAFADGHCHVRLPSGTLAIAAERTGSPELLALARQLADPVGDGDVETPGTCALISNQLRNLVWFDGRTDAPTAPLVDVWLPDLQVLVGHGGGTAMAVKGGHNAENHNHNDVGQFVLHRHGVPLLVDAGRGDYTAQTFGPRRYELWWTRASGHAVPQIDGHEQQAGRTHAARSVSCERTAAACAMTADLAACYGAEAGLRQLRRTLTLSRADGAVRLQDTVDTGHPAAYTLPLLTTACPTTHDDGSWLVEHAGQRVRILADMPVRGVIEPVELDTTLASSWQALWRLTLHAELPIGGTAGIRFVPA
jgi:hypothetical protein